MVHCTMNKLSHIFIKGKVKPTTTNTKASNLTQQGVKDCSDEATLCLRSTPYCTSLIRSSFICSGYLGFFPLRDFETTIASSPIPNESEKKNRVPGEQLTAEFIAIGARPVLIASCFCDLVTISVVPRGSRLSSQPKSPTSIPNAFCSPAFTTLRKSALLFFIFGSFLSLRYSLWSAMGLLRRD